MEIDDALSYERYLQYGAKPALMLAGIYFYNRYNKPINPLTLSQSVIITALNAAETVILYKIFPKNTFDEVHSEGGFTGFSFYMVTTMILFIPNLLLYEKVFLHKDFKSRNDLINVVFTQIGTSFFIDFFSNEIVSGPREQAERRERERQEQAEWERRAHARQEQAAREQQQQEWTSLLQVYQKDLIKTTDSILPEKYKKFKQAIRLSKTYFEVLGLERNATVDQINTTYRGLSRVIHPDKLKKFSASDDDKDPFKVESSTLFGALKDAQNFCLESIKK